MHADIKQAYSQWHAAVVYHIYSANQTSECRKLCVVHDSVQDAVLCTSTQVRGFNSYPNFCNIDCVQGRECCSKDVCALFSQNKLPVGM